MTTIEGLRYIDSDGHILEHPTAMPDYAPERVPRPDLAHRDRRRRARSGSHYNGNRIPANFMAAAGTAGMSDEDRARVVPGRDAVHRGPPGGVERQGPPRRTWTRTASTSPCCTRRCCSASRASRDVDFAEAQARAYNDWCSDHVQEGEGRLFGAGAVPPMHEPDDVAARRRRDPPRRRAAGHGVGVHAPEPGGRLAAVQRPGLRPDLAGRARTPGCRSRCTRSSPPDLPGACVGPAPGSAPRRRRQLRRRLRPRTTPTPMEQQTASIPSRAPSVLFTQAIANPVDVMSCIAYLLAGGVCERFPDAKFIFLEANGGWLVPWLERLDHHCRKFQWEVADLSMLPSEYMKRQCWISFDPDEAMLAHHRGVAARRRRPHHLGVRLPAPRRQVPGRHRGARRGARGADASSRSRRSPARARSRSTASADATPGSGARQADSMSSRVSSATGLAIPISGVPNDSARRTITRQNWKPPRRS